MSEEYGIVTASSWRLGPALKEIYPEIEEYTRVWKWARSLVKHKDKKFDEEDIYLTDPAFFSIFTFPHLKGDPKTALADKNSIVITEETANRYFGNEDPIGKIVYAKTYDANFKVTAVIQNIPKNSQLSFDIVARVDLMSRQRLESWEFTGDTYILLNENEEKDDVNRKIAGFYREHVDAETNDVPVLQELTKIHLYAHGTPGIIKQVYIFSVIAVFILLIACINFMNLSTARALKRAKEVGVRKIIGANRKQLIFQFLGESIIISFVTLILALLLIELVLPLFNNIAAKQLALIPGEISPALFFLVGITLITGIRKTPQRFSFYNL